MRSNSMYVSDSAMNLGILDLFSGIGGFSFALKPIASTIAYCDIDGFARHVLRTRISKGSLPKAPIFDDVTKLTKMSLSRNGISPANVNIITAGFPCQDVSIMNLEGRGVEGDRSKLVFQVLRLCKQLQPSLVVLENSPNLVHRGINVVVACFGAIGFTCTWGVYSASDVGAPHERRRLFLMAFRNRSDKSREILDTISMKFSKLWKPHPTPWERTPPPPRVRSRNETSERDLKLRGALLGNSVVPQCVRYAVIQLATSLRGRYWGLETLRPVACPPACKIVLNIPMSKRVPGSPRSYTRASWSTPLSQRWMATKVGGLRASRILQNQIMYERDTLKFIAVSDNPNIDEWIVNPEFVEWLMGYPIGWTRVIQDF